MSNVTRNSSTLANDSAPANGKIVLDAVHGYIRIELDYWQYFIDTPNFQRLKRIEQTNERPLYPCAHHDRFIHSLGTYHLGQIVCSYLKINSGEFLRKELERYGIDTEGFQKLFETLRKTFEIACLLHDIGHAPFSHTFEKYFGHDKEGKIPKPKIDLILSGKDKDKEIYHAGKEEQEFTLFCCDYENILETTNIPKEHERTSAILVLSEYFDSIVRFKVNPYLVARMIIGMPYRENEDDDEENKIKNQVANLLVHLLNGKTIDVDKLDYLIRDQWACGRVTKNVDYERLISSLYVFSKENGRLDVCYHKRAISEILTLVEVKKAIASTIHQHHLIKYDTYVLTEAIEEVADLMLKRDGSSNDDISGNDDIIGKIVSLQAIRNKEPVEVGGYVFRLLTDDDLVHIMKAYLHESQYAQEWFYRAYKFKTVWKTSADYNYFFKDDEDQAILHNNIEDIIKSFFAKKEILAYIENLKGCNPNIKPYITLEVDNEYNPIAIPDINILIKNEVVKLDAIASIPQQETRSKFFLLYIPKQVLEEKRETLIGHIKIKIEEYKRSALKGK
jgi:HD superfamily phosphohydrolase